MDAMERALKSILLGTVFWLSAVPVSAHQPDISSLTLIEQQPGHWMLRLSASVSAFQYEVKNAYGDDSYASSEEFNQLLLQHLRAQVALRINDHGVTLGNGFVRLGHATTVVFELSEVPGAVEEVWIRNDGFKNIRNSRSFFSVFRDGLEREPFVLSEENGFQTKVSLSKRSNRTSRSEPAPSTSGSTLIETPRPGQESLAR